MSDTKPDLDTIEARAKRAAWGWGANWTSVTEQAGIDSEWSTVHAAGKRDMVGSEDPDVTEHIAGMDPATTLALVAYTRTLEADNERLRAARDMCDLDLLDRAESAVAERDRLTRRLDQIRELADEWGEMGRDVPIRDLRRILDGDQRTEQP